jgi:protoheme IX farnesyltransferase
VTRTAAVSDTRVAQRDLLGIGADLVALTKPRIIVLLLVTGYCAMVVAARGLPGVGLTAKTLFGLALSAGGANAINMWYDRDIDRVMSRTQGRPVPSGRLQAETALWFGIACAAASMLLLGLGVNWPTALFALAGFVYYVFIYTMWLKRRTPQNIVIGGGAGALPPLVGWAAVTGGVGLAAALMFLIVFLWTPPHFWSLALYKDQDYRRAGIPMMPAVRGWIATKRQALLYAVLLTAASLGLYWTHAVGIAYLVAAAVLGAGFIAHTALLLRERKPDVAWAKRTFRFSLIYLTVVFAAMVLDLPH